MTLTLKESLMLAYYKAKKDYTPIIKIRISAAGAEKLSMGRHREQDTLTLIINNEAEIPCEVDRSLKQEKDFIIEYQ